jgi:hypothetical protein
MDSTAWTAVAACAAIVAALGAVGALLATTLELRQSRVDREVDYYRKLTPFLSLEVIHQPLSGAPPSLEVYADGGGYAFNVIVNLLQVGSTTGVNVQTPTVSVIRYLRQGVSKQIALASVVGPGFGGYLAVVFTDTFGILHSARQAVNAASGQLGTTAAMEWLCGDGCRVHVIQPVPPAGWLTRLAQRLRLY